MGYHAAVRGYRVAFAVLSLVAIAYQAKELADRDLFRPGNYFSFFTIQSNLLAAAVLIWSVTGDQDRRDPATVDLVRGAATLYLCITGLVVVLLLSGRQEELAVPLKWVDAVVHQVMPIVLLADWLIVPPTTRIPFRRALVWLVYPLVYAAYSLIRGPLVDWYPYPFLNPNHVGGYGVVALSCVGIAGGTFFLTWLVIVLGNRRRRR